MGMVGCFAGCTPEHLRALQTDPEAIPEFVYPEGGEGQPEFYLDVDKSWHGIHYLLTGRAEGADPPFGLAIFGGEEFGPEVGYGPARFLTPSEVAEVALAIGALTGEDLRGRFNPRDMDAKGIYPTEIWVRDGEEALDYLLSYFGELQQFYEHAAKQGYAVVQWLS